MENKELIEIIEENIKAYHYSQVDDSRSKSLEVARDTIIAVIKQLIYKEVMELIGEDEETFDDLGVGKNELRDELRAAARRRFLNG